MQLFRHHTGLPDTAQGGVVAIGNFDGLHLGHQRLIDEAGRLARERGRPHAVMTFEPHPKQLFRPGTPPFRLTPFRTKMHVLEGLGLDVVYVLTFDRTFAQRSAENFIEEVLVQGLGACHVVVGFDFCFGHQRRGTVDMLTQAGSRLGFGVTRVEPILDVSGQPYASSRIRRLLGEGNPAEAAALLGRPWEIDGRVEPGARLGRTLGFPTANFRLGETLNPAFGIYAVRVMAPALKPDHWYDGVANIGIRPTVANVGVLVEAHLFDFESDLYGQHLRMEVIDFIRPEAKFAGLEELTKQMHEDAAAARAILGHRRPAGRQKVGS
ncbi:MAG: bifunctional riboflavin kinase/FAD synthetase [Proteobacteria bacterium]|nr:bifunctional riboflavin kinase/FAD synthetase [Pseudomonadota bacterium]MBI3495743.1 bifunctional riboflavin kinase/FAD synthetase [Pseudomonadota bacterium]